MRKPLFTAGCDPEMFVTLEGRFFSAIPFIRGTKKKPQPLPSGAFVMRDNVAVEFGIPPANTEDEFVGRILTAIQEVKACFPSEFELAIVPSAHFEMGQLFHPEAQMFGCDPDFNAWNKGRQNEPPESEVTQTFRSCGGHLHTGFVYAKKHPHLFIQWHDLFHGMVATKLDDSAEAIARRVLYGKAGCYRPTAYGVEYRTLSNFWIKSENLIRLQYSLTNDICTGLNSGKMVLPDLEPDIVQKTINEGDSEFATAIVRDFLYDRYFSDHTKNLLGKVGYDS